MMSFSPGMGSRGATNLELIGTLDARPLQLRQLRERVLFGRRRELALASSRRERHASKISACRLWFLARFGLWCTTTGGGGGGRASEGWPTLRAWGLTKPRLPVLTVRLWQEATATCVLRERMHSFWQRLNAVFFYALSVLGFLAFAAAGTTYWHKPTPSVSISLKKIML
jgi:hypothetical protein